MPRQPRLNWFSNTCDNARTKRRRRRPTLTPTPRRLRSEPLEDRRMLAVVTVNNDLDLVNGDTSSIAALIANNGGDGIALREALDAANNTLGEDTVDFDVSLGGGTIILGGTELEITEMVAVDATSLAGGLTVDAQENSRIVNITAITGDFTFAGLTITGGKTTADSEPGGAIHSATTGHLTIDRSTISDSSTLGAVSPGGGIHAEGSVTLVQTIVSGNSTEGIFAYGGGIYASGDLMLTASTVSGNSNAGNGSPSLPPGGGGGIFARNAMITLSTISGNTTNGQGGGILARGVTIIQSTIQGNSATYSGGGVHAGSQMATIIDSTIRDNTASGGGGIVMTRGGTIIQSTISGNSATNDGGGIFNIGDLTITQSTVTDNQASGGGATGGGIWNFSGAPYYGDLEISGSIVAGNTADGGSFDINPDLGALAVNFSLIGTAVVPTSGADNVATDNPMLGPLQSNGGPTETHALLSGSLAIDAGDPGFIPPPDFDQRGATFARVVGDRIDIGAVESQDVPLPGDGNGDGWVDGLDYLLWAGNFATHPGPDGDPSDGDYNDDGWVDGLDYLVWAGNFGSHATTAASQTASAASLSQLAGATRALVITVDTLVDEADGSIVDGDVSLRDAIAAATSGDTIVFSVTGTIDLTLGELLIERDLTIAGPGAGMLSIDAGHGADNLPATFDGSRIFNIDDGNGASDIAVSISGLTLTGGDVVGDGGAIRTVEGLTLSDAMITDNAADTDGGGISATAALFGTTTITNSTVSGNTAGNSGGGVYVETAIVGTTDITGSTVADNSVLGFGFASIGGGIRVQAQAGGTTAISGSIISGNSAVSSGGTGVGGGIHLIANGGTVAITDSKISDNYIDGGSGSGAYVDSNNRVAVTISGTTVSDNLSTGRPRDSAAFFARLFSGTLNVSSSTFSGNSHGGFESGATDATTVTVTQSTFSGNAGHGMSVGGSRDATTITHSTIFGNGLKGVLAGVEEGGITTISSTIISGNGSEDVALRPDSDVGFHSGGYNLIGFGTAIGDFDAPGDQTGVASPGLLPLADNGGPTQTHALWATSPAIDAGDPVFVGPPDFDQRGTPFVRVVDANGDGARIDIGAVEQHTAIVAPPALVVDTLVDEFDDDFGPGDLSLREAIVWANVLPGSDAIAFDAILDGGTIPLDLGELGIAEAVEIDASLLAGGLTIDAQNNSRIFNITASSGDFAFTGLSLTGGRTTAGSDRGGGGAIYSNTSGNVTITRSTISGNRTEGHGADGGGVWSRGNVTLTGSAVSGNGTAGDFARGGGLFGFGLGYGTNHFTLTDSNVSGNSTAGEFARGGGIFVYGYVTLTDSTVSGNSTAGDSASGGGVSSSHDVTLIGSTVSENSTSGVRSSGGGIAASRVTLIDSTVNDNRTSGDSALGGGVVAGEVMLMGSTVSGNSTTGGEFMGFSAAGGGIASGYSTTIIQSTVADNHAGHASTTGGGVWTYDGTITITGSIVAGNTAGGGNPDLLSGNDTLELDYSLIGDTSDLTADELADINAGAGNLLDVDPLLAPLADNGGPTQTHALLPGSPAINAGDPTAMAGTGDVPLYDQRGMPHDRILGSVIDIGAYEAEPPTVDELLRQYVDDGVLNRGQANSLAVKLQFKGNDLPKPKRQQAFVNHVDAFVRAGILSDEQGQVLVDALDQQYFNSIQQRAAQDVVLAEDDGPLVTADVTESVLEKSWFDRSEFLEADAVDRVLSDNSDGRRR